MINTIYRHIFCLFSIMLLTVTNLVNAQHYRSSVIENTRAPSVDRFSGVKVNEETLLFYSIIDETPGIYALDVNTDRVTKLISNPRAEYIEYVHFTKGDNEVMVDLLDLLYVTDGTVDGTRFIGDFGTQDIGNVTSTIVSNVWKKEFINGDYFFYKYSRDHSPTELWKSSGSASSTSKVSLTQAPGIHKLITGPSGTGLVVFGYNKQVGFGFWQVDANDNTGSAIASFEKGDEKRDLRIVSSATVRAGTIFCREEWGTGTRSLLRLSKNGTLKRITEECSSDMVISGTTAYFFKNGNELWSSDGSEANTALVMAIADTEPDTDIGRIIRGTCLVDGILYTTRRSKVWRFDLKNSTASFPQTGGSFFCLSNGFIMSLGSPDDYDYGQRRSRSMLNVKTNEFHPVYGTGRTHYIESGPKALGVGPSGSIFKFGNDYYILTAWFRSAENYEDERSGTMIIKYVFKDSNYPVYLTPVLELLKD